MEDKNTLSTINNLVETAKSIIIILPPDPGKDLVIAASSLHSVLKESGKSSQIGCGSEVHVSSEIEGVSEISDTIGSRNLIISFDYQEDDLEKVDYDVRDDGKFYLLIKPKANAPVPDVSAVKYSYSGASADLVITLGVSSLEELGKIYAAEKNFLDNVATISLNTSLHPSAFTNNIYHQSATSFSELITTFMTELHLNPTPTVAQNLLSNIYETTSNLTEGHLSAETFSAISFLMKSGAEIPRQPMHTPHFSQAPFFEVPEEETAPAVEEEIPLPEEENAPVPADWNKPKIFRVTKNQNGQ